MMTLTRVRLAFGLTVSLLWLAPPGATAQILPPPRPQAPPPGMPPGRPGPPPPMLRVFLDCWECDIDHLRRTVRFVEYVRDRSVADLHLLVTTQSTGGGGSSWDVKFIGLGRFVGVDRTFGFTTGPTATSDERRREFARIFRLGLVAYAADTPAAAQLDVTFVRPPPARAAAPPARDPWKLWVFRTNGSASVSGERSSTNKSYRLSASGSRVTQAWKINVSAQSTYNRSIFTLSDDREVRSVSDAWNVNGLVVKSLSGKWSWGNRASASQSSFSNTERALGASTGIEFDFFPYTEANRRSLTVQYLIGATSYKYRELTIFDKIDETVPHQTLNMSLGLRQPWGSMGASAYYLQHLNHPDRLRLSLNSNADVRLFKGFSFYMWGGYSKIKDQIALRKGAATPEEILLRLTQQATNYSYSFSIGFGYSFGSIYTSIVNPRFSGSSVIFF